MNAWYFTFEFPPDFGGGLSTYMKFISQAYSTRGKGTLVVFTLSQTQSGMMSIRQIGDDVTLVTINPLRTGEEAKLGYWVNISRAFERVADLVMTQITTGTLNLPVPDYIEFPDGFGIGAITVQQKLCMNSRFNNVPIIVNAHTPTHIIDRLNQQPIYRLPNYWTAQMELQALTGADLVVAPSQAILDLLSAELERTGAKLGKSVVLHNPFPAPQSPPTLENATCDHFYMASRLTHWKGVESAIQALERLWEQGYQSPLRYLR